MKNRWTFWVGKPKTEKINFQNQNLSITFLRLTILSFSLFNAKLFGSKLGNFYLAPQDDYVKKQWLINQCLKKWLTSSKQQFSLDV